MKPTYDEVIREIIVANGDYHWFIDGADEKWEDGYAEEQRQEVTQRAQKVLRALQDVMPDISICDEGVTKYYNLHDAFNKYNHLKTLGRNNSPSHAEQGNTNNG